jgi:hypothetical protein
LEWFKNLVVRLWDRDKSDGVMSCLSQDNFTAENRPGSAHPRAQQRAVRRGLMLRVMSGVLSSLSVSQTTDSENT